ncbi:Ribosomal RNA small subunit methyltransferase I [Methyloligella halotolerans]|uniref:Ribosomal RNA small subunit methyltransferase I n=1 Tax=Methyloligella halotolerans TaxID=1177755 RepID=A0A1E2S0M7_9HYPH|nr:16S rRNA (cytidine(1402)-2'-O)-methyltransferase [Methyloligella halotolerans]ODA67888.1 Ribosomal RNA small subunit methyltransferase I [Methyloligella halotolerans]
MSTQSETPEDGNATALRGSVARMLDDLAAKPLEPGLSLVATPIGNLGDISLRALDCLARADVVACEDTRHSGRLLAHYGLKARLLPYHEHNAANARPKILAALREGAVVALISDAGTPLISDPGYKLVREALAEGIAVTAIPGASASLAGLSVSGLPSDSFFFAGFLPPKSAARKTRLKEVAGVPATLIFYETGARLAAALPDMAEVLGGRDAAVAKELTKLHEQVARGTLSELAGEFAGDEPPKGEFVVMVAPPSPDQTEASDDEIAAALEDALATESLRDAVQAVTDAFGVKRKRVYRLGLALQQEKDGGR